MICNIKQISESSDFINKIFAKVSFLRSEYPDFYHWFYNKVIPDLSNSSRKIFIAQSSHRIYDVNGILILKDTIAEKKICTLYVDDFCRQNGFGKKFMEISFNELNTKTPLITVSEHKIKEFSSLLKKFDFKLSEKNPDYYLKGSVEYSYNGHINLPELKIKNA